MAYDEQLAERIRDAISVRPDVTERKMFGGLGWMIGGNMAVGVMSTGGLLVRVEPDDVDDLIRAPHVNTFGREGAKPMKGFVIVDVEDLDEAEFGSWIDRGATRAASMPRK